MAAPKRKTAAKKPDPPADDTDWEAVAKDLSVRLQQAQAANKALRGQLVGFVQVLEGVVVSIRGESQPSQ